MKPKKRAGPQLDLDILKKEKKANNQILTGYWALTNRFDEKSRNVFYFPYSYPRSIYKFEKFSSLKNLDYGKKINRASIALDEKLKIHKQFIEPFPVSSIKRLDLSNTNNDYESFNKYLPVLYKTTMKAMSKIDVSRFTIDARCLERIIVNWRHVESLIMRSNRICFTNLKIRIHGKCNLYEIIFHGSSFYEPNK